MNINDFDYELPKELIAQTPAEKRDCSRLLVVDRETGEVAHKHFYDILEYLGPGDCLVLNNSKVLPARLFGVKEGTGAKVEFLLTKRIEGDTWETMVRPGKRLKVGDAVTFAGGPDGTTGADSTSSADGELFRAVVKDYGEDGTRIVEFEYDGIFLEVLERLGKMPLPPYIKEELSDPERYQTVYSRVTGSAAAPTAGLHFTPELLERIAAKGVKLAYVTLHVGLGTFRPVKAEEVTEHHMHSEFCMLSQATADLINETKRAGGRVVCVGTTSCRTLESLARDDGTFTESSAWTDIFIYPGYKFKAMDALITNFHLPESTLVMLVSAFAGREHVLRAYETAVQERYRFFSFGDAMFIY